MASIYNTAKWIYTPLGGFRTGEQWMVKPLTGAGRVGITRATNSTRVNEAGLLETVGPGIPAIDWIDGKPYTGVWGSSTNLVRYSEQFDNAVWAKNSGSSVTPNTFIAPDGFTTADNYVSGTTPGAPCQQSVTITVNPNDKYTFSIWVYRNNTAPANISIEREGAGTYEGSNFIIPTDSKGWKRYTVSHTFVNAQTGVRVSIRNETGATFDCYIWGAQLETGSFATPYIPTTSTTATRNADSLVASNASSIIGQTQGTVFVECDLTLNSGIGWLFTYGIDNNNEIAVFKNSNNTVNYRFLLEGVVTGSISNVAYIEGLNKIAFNYGSGVNECNFYVNGVDNGSFTVPSYYASPVTRIGFGARGLVGTPVSHLNDRLGLCWGTDQVLTDEQCIALTTL